MSTLSQLIPSSSAYRWANCFQTRRKQSISSHILSRRWMVLPLGKHAGTMSQPTPLANTYSSPCRQLRLSMGGQPLPHQTTGGRTGSNAPQTSSGSRRAKSEIFIAQALLLESIYRHKLDLTDRGFVR